MLFMIATDFLLTAEDLAVDQTVAFLFQHWRGRRQWLAGAGPLLRVMRSAAGHPALAAYRATPHVETCDLERCCHCAFRAEEVRPQQMLVGKHDHRAAALSLGLSRAARSLSEMAGRSERWTGLRSPEACSGHGEAVRHPGKGTSGQYGAHK